jgi:hypothetical protein
MCAASSGATPTFSTSAQTLDNSDGTWTVEFNDSATVVLTGAVSAELVGQHANGVVTTTVDLYGLEAEHYTVRQYSSTRSKSRVQTLKIKTKKPPHACTRTSKGTCIKGGQFCPQAKYGKNGWDASGRRYVCKGDHTHPHWLKS